MDLTPAPHAGPAPAPPGRDRARAAAVFLGFLALYHVNGRPQPEVDCVAAPYSAWSLVRHGTFDVHDYPELGRLVGTHVRALPDGRWVSTRPPGSALAAVPVVAPLAAFRERPPGEAAMSHLGKLAAAACAAGAAAVFYLLCRRLAPEAAAPATLLLAAGTSVWSVASQALWMHGPAVLCLCVALERLLPAGRLTAARAAAAGLALGLAVACRPTAGLFALASGAALLARREVRAAVALAAGGAVPAVLLVLLNYHLYGNPLVGGYDDQNWHDHPPFLLALGGLLAAPSKGLLVYSPAMLLVPAGAAALRRGRWAGARAVLWAWLAAAAATVVFCARWYDPAGGWCYGPRLLCETAPGLCLLFAAGYNALRRAWARRLAWALVGLSVAVHFLGVFGHSGYADWHERHAGADLYRAMFHLRDTQIEAHARAFLRKAARPFAGAAAR
jgi:hypothetical protein